MPRTLGRERRVRSRIRNRGDGPPKRGKINRPSRTNLRNSLSEQPHACLCFNCAPWAGRQLSKIMMPARLRADPEVGFQLLKRLNPSLRIRPHAVAASTPEGTGEKLRDVGAHRLQRNRARWTLHAVRNAVRSIGEAVLGDRSFNRHVARARISASKRMPTHVEEMKQEDCEAKSVVIGGPNKPAKPHPLKLRCCEQWHTYIAGEDTRSVPDLEGVAIDEHHSPI